MDQVYPRQGTWLDHHSTQSGALPYWQDADVLRTRLQINANIALIIIIIIQGNFIFCVYQTFFMLLLF